MGRVRIMKDYINTLESKLAASDDSLRLGYLALNTSLDGILIANADGIIEFANSAFTTITGFTSEDLIGIKCGVKLQGSLTDKNTIEEIRKASLNGKPIHTEILNYKKDGSTFWNDLTINPYFSEQSRPSNFISITRDITERKLIELDIQYQRDNLETEVAEKTKALQNSLELSNQARKALEDKNKALKAAQLAQQDSEERLSLATHAAGIGIWDLNLQTTELIWDDTMLELFDITREDFNNTVDASRKLLHPDDRSRAEKELGAVINDGKSLDIEFRIICKNNAIRYIKAIGQAFYDEKGIAIRILGVNMDITERTIVDRMKSEFVATAAHELRTPLSVIHGYTELLQMGVGDMEAQQEMLGAIHHQSQAMIDLLNDMLDVARIEAQAVGLFKMELQQIGPRLQTLADTFIIKGKHNKVTLTLSQNLPEVKVDIAKLEQAIKNCLSNSYKFSPKHGEVTMRVNEVTHDKQRKVLIAIEDQGIGMTPEQLERVFEKFYRADPSGAIPGTGLGMSIIKSIIEQHGGSIEIQSEYGKGTKVMLYLPVAS
jgi:PAS domain S-box-containing protein